MEGSSNEIVRIGALELKFVANKPELVMFEFVVPPNARVPAPHYHRDVDEVVFGLGGTLTTLAGGEEHRISPGESRFIPRGIVHTHENRHGETARALIVMTPGSIHRGYFEEVAEQVNGGKPDMAKMKEIMLRYGLVPA
jgi:quercetin dioxygenase-like cupin family protein